MSNTEWESAKAAARAAKDNCSRLLEEFRVAAARTIGIERELANAQGALEQHQVKRSMLEYPTAEETTRFESEATQLNNNMTAVAARRREAVGDRERLRLAVIRADVHFAQLARAEQNLRPENQERVALLRLAMGNYRVLARR